MTAHRIRLTTFATAVLSFVGGVSETLVAQTPVGAPPAIDTLSARCGPPGFGSLKEEDITIGISLTGGVQVSAVPLDECVIRMLRPDSYRALLARKSSKKLVVDSAVRNYRLQSYSLWSVLYYGVQQGEARFSPNEFVLRNVGRDFSPIRVVGLTSGFSEYRLNQREPQRGLFIFDGQIDLNQPIIALIQGTASSTDWQNVMKRVEQERALVRSRAAAKAPLE